MQITHKIQLEPTYKQIQYFYQACGTARFVYNWALENWTKQYKSGKKPKANDLKKQFNEIKYTQFPWLKEIHRDAHSEPFKNLQNAFNMFFKKKAKYPKFKKKSNRDSFYVANDRFELSDSSINLPKIGWVKLTETPRFFGKLISAFVSRTANKWFVSIIVEILDYFKNRISNNNIGIDLGLTNSITCSDGKVYNSPKPLSKLQKKLNRQQRIMSRRNKTSKRRQKIKQKLSKIHYKIRSIRNDWINKITTQLCRENQMISIEDLSVKNMMKNHKLARSISDQSWSEFRRQLEYKSKIYKNDLIIADRFYPSSKICSKCGYIKDGISLKERVFECPICGLSLDRDLNAAINISRVGYTRSDAQRHCIRPLMVKATVDDLRTNQMFMFVNIH